MVLEQVCLIGSVFGIIGMVLLIMSDLVARSLWDAPIAGAMEVTEDFLMIATVYLAMGMVYKQGGHIRITLLRTFIPRLVRNALDVLAALLVVILFGAIGWFGLTSALRAIRFGEFSNSVLAYPLFPVYLILALGCILLCVRIGITVLREPANVWGDGE
ncbi:MAG: TRAP transporter small permease [Thermoleophilia bacterium]